MEQQSQHRPRALTHAVVRRGVGGRRGLHQTLAGRQARGRRSGRDNAHILPLEFEQPGEFRPLLFVDELLVGKRADASAESASPGSVRFCQATSSERVGANCEIVPHQPSWKIFICAPPSRAQAQAGERLLVIKVNEQHAVAAICQSSGKVHRRSWSSSRRLPFRSAHGSHDFAYARSAGIGIEARPETPDVPQILLPGR